MSEWKVAENDRAIEAPDARPIAGEQDVIMATWWKDQSILMAFAGPGGITLGQPVKVDNPRVAAVVAELRRLIGPPPWEAQT